MKVTHHNKKVYTLLKHFRFISIMSCIVLWLNLDIVRYFNTREHLSVFGNHLTKVGKMALSHKGAVIIYGWGAGANRGGA